MLRYILNLVSLGLVLVSLIFVSFGKHDEAGFVLLLAIYTDGRLFLIK